MKAAEKACNGLPNKYAPTCRAFVDTYTAAVVALLAQDIDPSQVSASCGLSSVVVNHCILFISMERKYHQNPCQ